MSKIAAVTRRTLGAASLVLLLAAPWTTAQEALLFEGARLIIGNGDLIQDGALLIEDEEIVAIGAVGEVELPAGGRRIDLRGATVMPALLDGHAHLGYQSASGWGAEHYSRENLLRNLRQYAWYGFSAVLSAGSDPEQLVLSLQEEQRSGQRGEARLLIAAGMGPPGQGPNDAFLEEIEQLRAETGMTLLRGVGSPVAAIEQVRAVAEQDIPFIKIWVDDRGGSQVKLSPDVYLPLMAEAMRQRIQVLVHQQFATDMPPLLEAGASGFLHGRLGPALGREIAAATAASRAFVVPNLGLAELRRETVGRDPFLAQMLTPARRQRLSLGEGQRQQNPGLDPEREAALRESLAHLLDAGADIVLGTDAGALPDHPFGYSGHRELQIYVRLGMTPMQALVAATGNAARQLGQEDLGLLEPGRRADLLILDANPLTDIRNSRAIRAVYLGGREIDREAIAAELSGR